MLRFILFFFLSPCRFPAFGTVVSLFENGSFKRWNSGFLTWALLFSYVDTDVSLRGHCCFLTWILTFPYVGTVVSLRGYSGFLARKLPVPAAETDVAPGAYYGNSV